MDKRTKNIIIASTAAVAGLTALGITAHKYTSHKIMKLALDRNQPKLKSKNMSKLRGSDELEKIDEILLEAGEKLKSKNLRKIQITSHDGLRLAGHWYCPENPKRVIIAMHGWRSEWTRDMGVISDFWHENDCAVLYAEQRAHGESEGEYISFGLLERYDCLEWIKWAVNETESKLPIYLCGVSMGASTVLMAAGFDLPENVHGIIADCGFTSPYAIFKHIAQNNLHIPYGIYNNSANGICKKKISLTADSYTCGEALKNTDVPVLFIHGTDDSFVPIEMTYENYKECVSPKRLFVVPGAEHGLSYLKDKEGYEKAVKEFWNDFDGKSRNR